jgi:hypothetical protein
MENGFEETINAVRTAEEALIKAQENSNPEDFQHAKQLLQFAEMQLHKHGEDNDPEHQKRLFHAKEHMRHLLETQNAIQEIRYD